MNLVHLPLLHERHMGTTGEQVYQITITLEFLGVGSR